MAMLASLFANDSTAATRHLIGERTGILAENTRSIDDIGREAEHLKQCVEALEKSNATIFTTLAGPEGNSLSQEQMAEMLRKLTSVMTTDVPKLTTDLQKIRENKSVLRELVEKMRDLKARCEIALQRLGNVAAMDEKSVQNLTVLRGKTIQAGISPTCHDGSVLL